MSTQLNLKCSVSAEGRNKEKCRLTRGKIIAPGSVFTSLKCPKNIFIVHDMSWKIFVPCKTVSCFFCQFDLRKIFFMIFFS